MPQPQEAKALTIKITSFSSQHKRAEAQKAIRDYLRGHKADLVFYLAAGNGFNRGRDFQQSMKYLEEGLRRNPKSLPLLFARAKTWLDVGEPEKAEADLKLCAAMDPSSGQVHGQMASLYSSRGEAKKALVECETAIKLEPASAELWSIKSGILANQGQYKEALAAADHGVALRDKVFWVADLLRDRAALRERLGQYAGAIDDYNAYLKSDGYSNVRALVKVGDCYMHLKKPQKALPYFEMALRLRQDLLDAHRGKLSALEAMHQTDAAAREKKIIQDTLEDFSPNKSF